MSIIQFTSSLSSGIPYIGDYSNAAALEPAEVGTKRLCTIPGTTRSGSALIQRFSDRWDVVGADSVTPAYLSLNPIPAATYNPFRTHIYLTPAGGGLEAETTASVRSTTSVLMKISNATFTWTTVRLIMANINGTPVAPEGVWFSLSNVGVDNPVSGGGTWVAATGLKAPPAGTDDEPGIGPVCDYVSLPGSTTANGIVVRIQMPAGDIVYGNISTTPSCIPDFVSRYSKAIDGPISSNPGTVSGWGEAFGMVPWYSVQIAGLSVPQCMLGVIGDSHALGYRADNGGQGTRGMFGELFSLMGSKNICITNLARSGHKTSQMALRLRAFETQLDMGGWIRQRASVNDSVGGTGDYTAAQALASYNQLTADWTYLNNRTKLMIPFEGAGANGGPTGWYSRFNTYKETEKTNWPYYMYDASAILNVDGSYQTDMGGPDGGHPSLLGYQTWAPPSWTSLQAALTTLNVTV